MFASQPNSRTNHRNANPYGHWRELDAACSQSNAYGNPRIRFYSNQHEYAACGYPYTDSNYRCASSDCNADGNHSAYPGRNRTVPGSIRSFGD